MERRFNTFIQYLLIITFSVIVLLALLQIGSRYVGQPLRWSDEAIRYLFVWFIFIGTAYAIREKKHIVVDFISDRFSRTVVWFTQLTVYVLMCVFIWVLIYYGFDVATTMKVQLSPLNRIPMTYVFLAIPVGGVLMLFYTILNIIDLFKERRVSQ
ncbi:TRAP transporter small permease [Alkalihalobacillus sp. MEB130]|uniref:TRAP transporter small permease n=1 Tax=Alkalihalobacillus sp. MEB130 TaxID=2976704 RepID=UPI0028DDF82C|nr:TRAP transporter small permease [Alkalihalobacillus sp. MEB130]MDT8860351.1 TRAP transporter small permease [Alkalihalobacillus sp. MEB130]